MRARPAHPGGSEDRAASVPGKALQWAGFLAGFLIALLINHRSYLLDFNMVPGDLGDTRLVVFTLEHWFRVLLGQEPFFTLQMFYPDPDGLAYADGLFLFGLPYSFLRAAGLDYFTSYQLTLPFLTAVGYWGWLYVFRRALRLNAGFAVLGAVLLTGMNSLQMQADHGKFSAIHLFPVLILLLWSAVTGLKTSRTKALLACAAFGALLALLFFTSYYPAWFFLFTLVILGLVALLSALIAAGPRNFLRTARDFAAAHWSPLLAAVAAFAVFLIPFGLTYGALIGSDSTRSFSLVLEFAPRLRDVINVSARNIIWSPPLSSVGYEFGNREVQMGSPLLVLLAGMATTIAVAVQARRVGWRNLSAVARFVLLLSATALVLVIISSKWGGFSLWLPFYRYVPGASALRALGRILMMVDILIVTVATVGLDAAYRYLRGVRMGRAVFVGAGFALLSLLLVVEELNGMAFRLDKAGQITMLGRFRPPEEPCAAFFMNNSPASDWPFGYYHLDAMMIGMKLGIPTVNGYSGFEPHEAFTLPTRGTEYKYRILDWLLANSATEGICELDYETASFRVVDAAGEFTGAQEQFHAELMANYTALLSAARQFLEDGHDLSDLNPQFLQDHGYLDASLRHETGTRHKWVEGRYWIGERSCGNHRCVGIALIGRYGDLKPIIERYAPLAHVVHFPNHETPVDEAVLSEQTFGEALLIFRPESLID